jgi:cupin fold WbuC family metalloprotein
VDIKIFSNSFLEDLRRQSSLSLRKRKNHNLHFDYEDPCQRLFNAIEMSSYIRPHRHSLDPVMADHLTFILLYVCDFLF